MAVKEENQNVGRHPEVHAASVEAPTPSGHGSTDFVRLLSRFEMDGAISAELSKYIDDLRSNFAKADDGTLAGKITVHRLLAPTGAHAFVSNNNAIIFVFTETIPVDLTNFTPQSDYIRRAVEEFRAAHPDVRLLNAVLIRPGDYTRISQAYSYLVNNLAVASFSHFDIDLSQVGAGGDFLIDYDTQSARNLINNSSPTAVQPRIDIGFTLKVKLPRRLGPQTQYSDETKTVLAVGAFVDMIALQDPATGGFKFVPTVRITNITAAIPFKGAVHLGITVAANVFIRNHQWKRQFDSYAKRAVNLGNLILDQKTNGPLFLQNAQQREAFIHQYCFPPVLGVDIVDGAPRIPSLVMYNNDNTDKMSAVSEQLRLFFGRQPPAAAPFRIWNTEYVGTVGDEKGHLQDSRCIDYLNLVAVSGVQDEDTRQLLSRWSTPVRRASIVANKTGTFRSESLCITSVLNYEMMNYMAAMTNERVRILDSNTDVSEMPADWVTQQYQYLQTHGLQSATQNVGRTDWRSGVTYSY